MKYGIHILFLSLMILAAPARSEMAPKSVNKLLYMYRLYYLPFSIDFREGRTQNDILPFRGLTNEASQLLSADDLSAIDRQWDGIRDSWRKRSLLLSTVVATGERVRVAPRIVSHKISLTRSALDTLSIPDRIQINDLLRGKNPDVLADFKQLRFIKSFMEEQDEEKFNLFLFSASWCSSCREYRTLIESYLKANPQTDVVFHSVVIDDPAQKIFQGKILSELFPHPERNSHDSIPKFIAFEKIKGKNLIHEEGDALFSFFERYLKPLRGFLDGKSLLFRGQRQLASPQADSLLNRSRGQNLTQGSYNK